MGAWGRYLLALLHTLHPLVTLHGEMVEGGSAEKPLERGKSANGYDGLGMHFQRSAGRGQHD